jgi:3-oxoacyl-[acyl-carrier protein] reductase
MDLGIAGRVALVTAASRGLGRATALALAQEGAKVAVCARGEADLAAVEGDIAAAGAEVLVIPADVTDPAVPQRLVDATVERFGALDILIGNAGGPPPGRALDVDDAALERAINANLMTSIRLVRAAVVPMRHQGWGRICLIASFYVKQPSPGLALSNTARTGLWAWAKTAAHDLFAEGITLNLACPGPHATDRMLELGPSGGPMGDPADFGRVVAFLCSAPANFISGAALQVDGGATLALS